MAFNVSDFRKAMHYDGQRPNLFEVAITPSTEWANFSDLGLFCKGTSIPGATLGTVIVPYFGREVKLAGNRTFPEWTVTVLNDENFSIRSQFESWMNAINAHGGNARAAGDGTSTSYVKSAMVKQYSKQGSVATGTYEFVNLFPIRTFLEIFPLLEPAFTILFVFFPALCITFHSLLSNFS